MLFTLLILLELRLQAEWPNLRTREVITGVRGLSCGNRRSGFGQVHHPRYDMHTVSLMSQLQKFKFHDP